jgi:hypothetical protein
MSHDIPTINDGQDWTQDERMVLAALDDQDSPTEQQLAIARATGGWIFPKSDRTESGGIPIGMGPDKIGGSRINLMSPREDGAVETFASFVIDGINDPIVREVMNRHAAANQQAAGDPKAYYAAWEAAMLEISAIKAAEEEKKRLAAPKPPANKIAGRPMYQPTGTAVSTPRKTIDVDFEVDIGVPGRPLIRHILAQYADASIQGNFLVLTAYDDDRASGVTVPPESEAPYLAKLAGLDKPVLVMYAGVTHVDAGKRYFLLFIDRSGE